MGRVGAGREDRARRLSSANDKLASERAGHKEEIATLRAKRSRELEEVSTRVRLTVEKKETTIRGLQKQIHQLEANLNSLV